MERDNAFKTYISEEPFLICVVCNRCLWRRSVSSFRFDSCKYVNENIIFGQ